MADVSIALGGFGSQGWGVAAWGEGNVSFVATGQVGSVTVQANANVSVTGLSATGQVGSVTVTGAANVNVTGLQATGAVGSVVVTGTAVVDVTGVFGTGQVGTVTVNADANVILAQAATDPTLKNVGATTPEVRQSLLTKAVS